MTAFVRETAIARRVTDRHRLTSYLDHDAGGDGRPAYLALSFVSGKHLGELTKSARWTTRVSSRWPGACWKRSRSLTSAA